MHCANKKDSHKSCPCPDRFLHFLKWFSTVKVHSLARWLDDDSSVGRTSTAAENERLCPKEGTSGWTAIIRHTDYWGKPPLSAGPDYTLRPLFRLLR